MSSEDQRRADALSIGGQTARLRVGDEARSLLVGGHWQDGHWYLIDAARWITPQGQLIIVEQVQGVALASTARWSEFATAVDDIEDRSRCAASWECPAPDLVWSDDEVAYCETCQRNVPVIGDPPRYTDHDKRGRTIEAGEGRA
jgi:hypothetical protein